MLSIRWLLSSVGDSILLSSFLLHNINEIRHGLMLLWSTDLMNVTEEATIHRPNVSPSGTRQECRNVGSMDCSFFGYIH